MIFEEALYNFKAEIVCQFGSDVDDDLLKIVVSDKLFERIYADLLVRYRYSSDPLFCDGDLTINKVQIVAKKRDGFK